MLIEFENFNGKKIFINPNHVWCLYQADVNEVEIISVGTEHPTVVKGTVEDVAKFINGDNTPSKYVPPAPVEP